MSPVKFTQTRCDAENALPESATFIAEPLLEAKQLVMFSVEHVIIVGSFPKYRVFHPDMSILILAE
jgi:hypothetical protein